MQTIYLEVSPRGFKNETVVFALESQSDVAEANTEYGTLEDRGGWTRKLRNRPHPSQIVAWADRHWL